MDNFTILNYQGSKSNLHNYICEYLEPYIQDGKAILDIFSGSGAVSNMFRTNYQVYANDAEYYASIIADALLNQPDLTNINSFINSFECIYAQNNKLLAKPIFSLISAEEKALHEKNFDTLKTLYSSIPTVWNQGYSSIVHAPLTVENIKSHNDYYLFTTYYAGTYFGIQQSLEIDCIIKCIHSQKHEYHHALFSCLFFAMKEAVL